MLRRPIFLEDLRGRRVESAAMNPCIKAIEGGVEIRLKVVPGATRSQVDGLYGDALKVRVAAPPQRGKANLAVIEILANVLGVSKTKVTVVGGLTSPRKTVRIADRTVAQAATALGLA